VEHPDFPRAAARGNRPLLLSRRFLPLFVAQALGALNDNILKGAIVVLAVFAGDPATGASVAMLAGGILVLPFLLFSALAGQLADRYPKPLLVRRIKLAEIPLALAGTAAFVSGEVGATLAVLFFMGTQSTFFGPLKYGILPELVREDELVTANGHVEASTFLVILLGTILGSFLGTLHGGPWIVGMTSTLVAVAGWLASLFVPDRPAAAPELRIRPALFGPVREILGEARRRHAIWRTILAISWFWAIGGIYLAQIPAWARAELGAGERAATLLLSTFVLGIAVGALATRALVHARITLRPVPWAMAGIGVFGLDLVRAAAAIGRFATPPDVAAFLAADGVGWLLFDLFALAAAGGVFAVPLYAFLQARSPAAERGRMVAANNILNALFLVVSAGLVAGLLALGVGIGQILVATAVADVLLAAILFRLAPATERAAA